mmetsp:Transcript_1383/g.3046  ORF Transcript_1383/g.3046 Transcript_1383/m.3046 type:complete len:208 (-) Transcript_1383:1915-2538(-)
MRLKDRSRCVREAPVARAVEIALQGAESPKPFQARSREVSVGTDRIISASRRAFAPRRALDRSMRHESVVLAVRRSRTWEPSRLDALCVVHMSLTSRLVSEVLRATQSNIASTPSSAIRFAPTASVWSWVAAVRSGCREVMHLRVHSPTRESLSESSEVMLSPEPRRCRRREAPESPRGFAERSRCCSPLVFRKACATASMRRGPIP